MQPEEVPAPGFEPVTSAASQLRVGTSQCYILSAVLSTCSPTAISVYIVSLDLGPVTI